MQPSIQIHINLLKRTWQAKKMMVNYATEKGVTEAKAGWSQTDTGINKGMHAKIL